MLLYGLTLSISKKSKRRVYTIYTVSIERIKGKKVRRIENAQKKSLHNDHNGFSNDCNPFSNSFCGKRGTRHNIEPNIREPNDSVEVTGTDFAASSPVGIGFGAEVAGSDSNMAYSGTGPGPYSGKVSHWPIKPGSFNLTATLLCLVVWSHITSIMEMELSPAHSRVLLAI